MKEKKLKMREAPIKPEQNMKVETFIPDFKWIGMKVEDIAREWPGAVFIEDDNTNSSIWLKVTTPEPMEEYGKRLDLYFTEKASYEYWRKQNEEKILELEAKERLDKIAEIERHIKELEMKQKKTNRETINLILQKKKELDNLRM